MAYLSTLYQQAPTLPSMQLSNKDLELILYTFQLSLLGLRI